MYLLNASDQYIGMINELAFTVALLITVIFYVEYKKCEEQIKKEEMLERFLNEK